MDEKYSSSTYINGGNPNPSGNYGRNNKIDPRTGRAWRRYCWSCGCCDHWSCFCPNRKSSHKVDATFKNCMGGSTTGVLGA